MTKIGENIKELWVYFACENASPFCYYWSLLMQEAGYGLGNETEMDKLR